MPATFQRVSSSSLPSRIASRIREAILNGTLLEGERLVERRLAEEFGASLTAVREALVLLEAEGFIIKLPNAATHVIRLSPQDAEKILDVRRVLESHAVAEAARRGTDEQVALLQQSFAEARTAAANGDGKELMQRCLHQHELLWRMAGNEYMETALRRLVLPFFAFCAIRMMQSPKEEWQEELQVHGHLFDAVSAHDADAARAAFGTMLDRWAALARG